MRSRSMVVRALVGPRPVLSASRWTMAWEMAALSAASWRRSAGDSGGVAMRSPSRLPQRGLAPGEEDDEQRRECAVAAGAADKIDGPMQYRSGEQRWLTRLWCRR